MLINPETIAAANTATLREMAKELGVKYASKKTKAVLQFEIEEAWQDQTLLSSVNAQCDVCGETEHTTADHDLADNEEVETLIEEMEEADGPDMLVDDASDEEGVTADYQGIPRRDCPSCKREGTIRPHIKGDYCQWADCGYVADRATDEDSVKVHRMMAGDLSEDGITPVDVNVDGDHPELDDLIGGVVDSEDALTENFSPEEQLVIRVAQHLGLTLASDFEFPGKGKAIKTTEGATIYLNSSKSAEVKATDRNQAIRWEQDALGTRTKPMYLRVDVTSF